MAVVWRLGLVLFGFAAATLLAALLHTPAADAAEPAAERPALRGTAGARPAETDPALAYERQPRRLLRGAAEDEAASDATLYDDPDEAGARDPLLDGADGESPEAEAPRDGDLSLPREGPEPADGIADVGEPAPLEDGADLGRDSRPAEDIEVFANPPAGHDPLLFQVEDIDPVTRDRRPARLARFEPFDPVGIRIGSFVFFPEAEVAGLWTDNVLSSPAARADIAAEILTTSRLVSNWSTHALELKGTTLSSFYDDFPSEDDRAWSLEARGRLDVTRRTNVQALALHSFGQESRTAIDASEAGERADVTTDAAELALNHRFSRLSVRLRGAVADTTYADTDGTSNRDRDTLETTEAVRARWEMKPTLAVFAEEELNQREKRAVPADGIPRDSEGTRTRVGLDFGATGALLRGEASVGYGRQVPDDRRLTAVDAFLFDANLAWRPSEITSFLLTAQSDIYETTTATSGGVIAHTVGIEARHALRRYLVASAGLLYTHYDYDATPFRERELTGFAGIEYYASPELVLFARYEHLDFASNSVDGDYQRDEVRVGARVRR